MISNEIAIKTQHVIFSTTILLPMNFSSSTNINNDHDMFLKVTAQHSKFSLTIVVICWETGPFPTVIDHHLQGNPGIHLKVNMMSNDGCVHVFVDSAAFNKHIVSQGVIRRFYDRTYALR